ncbi:Uncharacterised protein [uncultured archaeon]|nr:Uncharacterised protein [uncultured archaeon]
MKRDLFGERLGSVSRGIYSLLRIGPYLKLATIALAIPLFSIEIFKRYDDPYIALGALIATVIFFLFLLYTRVKQWNETQDIHVLAKVISIFLVSVFVIWQLGGQISSTTDYLCLFASCLVIASILYEAAPKRGIFNKGAFSKRKNYFLILIFIFFIGFFLRFWNLTILDPYTDEYSHIIAAKDLLEFKETDYTRGMLVTYAVRLFYEIGQPKNFYDYLFWGRLPGVIFGAVTIFPLYFLGRRISKDIGILSSFLWAISPWAIGVSRNIREYAYYPFFILIVCLIALDLIESIISYSKKKNFKIASEALVIVAFVFYAFKVDYLSSLRTSFILFPVIGMYFFISEFRAIRKVFNDNRRIGYSILFFSVFLGLFLVYFAINSNHISYEDFDGEYVWSEYYFNPVGTPMHWWQDNESTYIVFFLVGIGILFSARYGNKEYFLNLMIFGSYEIFFLYFFDRYPRPRYIFYALPFFIVLISTSLFSIFRSINIFSNRRLKYVFVIFLVFFSFSIFKSSNILFPITSDDHGYVKTTNEHHDRVNNTVSFLGNEIEDKDVFITTFFSYVLPLTFNISQNRIYPYKYDDSKRFDFVAGVIENNSQGLMILDYRRNGGWSKGFPKKGNFTVAGINVVTLQNVDGIQVYRWKHDGGNSMDGNISNSSIP